MDKIKVEIYKQYNQKLDDTIPPEALKEITEIVMTDSGFPEHWNNDDVAIAMRTWIKMAIDYYLNNINQSKTILN